MVDSGLKVALSACELVVLGRRVGRLLEVHVLLSVGDITYVLSVTQIGGLK